MIHFHIVYFHIIDWFHYFLLDLSIYWTWEWFSWRCHTHSKWRYVFLRKASSCWILLYEVIQEDKTREMISTLQEASLLVINAVQLKHISMPSLVSQTANQTIFYALLLYYVWLRSILIFICYDAFFVSFSCSTIWMFNYHSLDPCFGNIPLMHIMIIL